MTSPAPLTIPSQPDINVNSAQGTQNLTNPLATYILCPMASADESPDGLTSPHALHRLHTPHNNKTDRATTIAASMHATSKDLTRKVTYLVARQSQHAPFSVTGVFAGLRKQVIRLPSNRSTTRSAVWLVETGDVAYMPVQHAASLEIGRAHV